VDDRDVSTLGQRAARLRALDLFATLGGAELERLARGLVALRYLSGAAIIREGDQSDYFYIVVTGEVEVDRGGRVVAVRGPGEYFGEIALLHGIPRTATVLARTVVSLYALDGTSFVAAATADANSRRVAAAVVAERLAS